MLTTEIEKFRKEIDSIDNDILRLISKRKDYAVRIGSLKDELRASSSEKKLGAYDSKRESEIIQKLTASSDGISEYAIEAIFREIISFCRNSAHKTAICILGDDWHYVEAAKAHFGRSCEFKTCSDMKGLMAALADSLFNIALVPLTVSDVVLENLMKSGYIQNDTITIELENEMTKAYVFVHE